MENRYWNRTGAAQAHYDEMEAAGFEYTQATYCRICGQTRRNQCMQEYGEVEHFNPANARFCETCGARTVFFAQGLLLPWDKVPRENKTEVIPDEDDLPF